MEHELALTQKQENFCLAYIETGNASEAYRRSYNAVNMKTESINVNACKLLADANVAQRVEILKGEAAKRHAITVDSLIAELEEARQAALQAETPQSSAAVSATMGKAKLAGLDKQIVEQTTRHVFEDSQARRMMEQYLSTQ
jgi:phage terminase small subunit